jgi:hypothetical protein
MSGLVAHKMTIFMQKRGDKDDSVPHLHIILNDPGIDRITSAEDMVIIVNCTSIKEGVDDYDKTCILKAGCHPFIVRDSYITYRRITLESAYFIETKIASGDFITYAPVAHDLYIQILSGLLSSKAVSLKYKRFIKAAIEQNACGDFQPIGII